MDSSILFNRYNHKKKSVAEPVSRRNEYAELQLPSISCNASPVHEILRSSRGRSPIVKEGIFIQTAGQNVHLKRMKHFQQKKKSNVLA